MILIDDLIFYKFRCEWATRDRNQESVLAIWLKRSAFERILSMAITSSHGSEQKEEWEKKINKQKSSPSSVRLQWDPDHGPHGEKHPNRRAIQLGLKGIQTFISGEDIIDIQDITSFVAEQYKHGKREVSECTETV